jgi:hypothetical protein
VRKVEAMTSRQRIAALVAVGCVFAFWICTLVAGALVEGYSIRADYISSLAGRGSSVAVIGIVALTLLGSAHLAAAVAVRGIVAVPLVLAGLAGLTVAGFRTNCPAGAAGCGSAGNDPPADLAQLTHGNAVVTYEIAIVVAMLIVAGGLFARHRPALAALTVAIAALSVLLALQIGGSDTGWWQRGWLLVNTGWLVALVLTTTRPSRSTPPVPPG